jgi:hypothetical protein
MQLKRNEITSHIYRNLCYDIGQSSNIQNNIAVNHSRNNILLLQRKLNAVATFPVKLQYTKKPSPTEDP